MSLGTSGRALRKGMEVHKGMTKQQLINLTRIIRFESNFPYDETISLWVSLPRGLLNRDQSVPRRR